MMPASMNVSAPHVTLSRRLTVASLLGLIALGLAWELWLAPIRPGGSWLALKVLPLCVLEGLVRATSEPAPGAWLAMLEVLLSIALFIGCTLHIRLRLRAAREAGLTETAPP